MLEKHLVDRFAATDGAPISMAIDGRWGSGKTFFVKRWTAQLRNNKRCIIEFDAWQHDQSGNAALACMAEISRQVRERTALVIDSSATMAAVDSALKDALSSIKRAAKPVTKALFSAALKRYVGASIKDLAEAAQSDDGSDSHSEETSDSTNAAIDKAVDQYLDQILVEHEIRHASVEKFRKNLEGLASSLARASAGPVFLIIDELDRCRPSFAVELLEGVKHLFSVRNVCFIFSTNLSQLAASVQAVYGPNFDGRDYLSRFFDQELVIPQPSGEQFARLLFRQQGDSSTSPRLGYGIFTFPRRHGDNPAPAFWSGICRALGVTLRQQQQAFTTYVIACESYPKGFTIPAVWLMFLSVLHRANPAAFAALHTVRGHGWEYSKFLGVLQGFSWQEQSLLLQGRQTDQNRSRIALSQLLYNYFHVSKHQQPQDIELTTRSADPSIKDLTEFLTGNGRRGTLSQLHLAFDIVSMAGLFSQGTNDDDR